MKLPGDDGIPTGSRLKQSVKAITISNIALIPFPFNEVYSLSVSENHIHGVDILNSSNILRILR